MVYSRKYTRVADDNQSWLSLLCSILCQVEEWAKLWQEAVCSSNPGYLIILLPVFSLMMGGRGDVAGRFLDVKLPS